MSPSSKNRNLKDLDISPRRCLSKSPKRAQKRRSHSKDYIDRSPPRSHTSSESSADSSRSFHSGSKSRSRSYNEERRGRERERSRSRSRERNHSKSSSYSGSQDSENRHKKGSSGGRHYKSSSRSASPRRRRHHPRSRSGSPLDPRRTVREKPPQSRCIGVFGLSVYTTQQKIRDIFGKFGPIDRIQVVIDSQTGRSRGFCFIYYEHLSDAKRAKAECSGIDIDDRRIRVDYSITQRPHPPTPGVYMGRPTRYNRYERENEYQRKDYQTSPTHNHYYNSQRNERYEPSERNQQKYYDRQERYERSKRNERYEYQHRQRRSYTPNRSRY